ncbi:MAG: SDR family oxidoreductase [Terriglobus sp.]
MRDSLHEETALITGAARGFGRATALEFARRGVNLILNDRNADEDLASVVAEARELGVRADSVVEDLNQRQGIERIFDAVCERYDALDILVNNAADSVRKPFLELAEEEVAQAWSVSQLAPMLCSQFAARQMVAQGCGGAIIMVSSVHAERPYPNALPYNAAKAAVNHMAASMALELAEHGIRVNTVEPGWIDTPGERRHYAEDEIVARGRTLPMGRLGKPEEVARAIAFLCSGDASYITGSVLRVDGGFALRF